jgi:hypothetical protein
MERTALDAIRAALDTQPGRQTATTAAGHAARRTL